MEKSCDDVSSRKTGWQIYRTWRLLPKLEIYRTDSYKSETATTPVHALENFYSPPLVKIFSSGRRSKARAKVPEWKRNDLKQDRDVDVAVKTSKSWQTRVCRREIYGLSLERSRFIEQTKCGVVEEKFSSRTKLHARRKHFRCEKN